jgi:hypothetical protein
MFAALTLLIGYAIIVEFEKVYDKKKQCFYRRPHPDTPAT